MNAILFEDLAKTRDILNGLEKLTQANIQFGDVAVNQNLRVRQSINENVLQLQEYRNEILGVNNANKDANTTLAGLKTHVDQAKASYKSLNDHVKQNEQFVKSNVDVIDQMRKRLADLSVEYNKLDLSQKQDLKRKKEIEQELTQTTKAYDALIRVTERATKATKTAEGSYNALDQATKKLRADLKAMPDAFDAGTNSINKNNKAALEMQKQIERNDKALKGYDASMGLHQRNVGNYSSAFKELGSTFLGFSTIAGAAYAAIQLISTGVGIIANAERLNSGLKAASRDNADYARSQQYLMALADKLGVEYTELIGSYKNLKSATKDTVLEGQQTEKIFTSVATAGAKLGLSNDEVSGTLRALTQMISKGKISAEELRGQLGERLPMAIRLMSEALGVSEAKLNKMMEQGQLISTEVMPKFADALSKNMGLKQNEQINNMGSGFNRLKNEIVYTLSAFNENKGITNFFNAITNGLSHSLGDIRRWLADGSVKELFMIGSGGIVAKNQERRDNETYLNKFSGMDSNSRIKEMRRIQGMENEQARNGERENAKMYYDLRQKMIKADRDLQTQGAAETARAVLGNKKAAIERDENDLARFQKQAVRKRTAEIMELEKAVVKDPKNELLAKKLEVYTRLDAEQRQKEKEVSARIKSTKETVNTDSELEKLDKRIKSIAETLQTQAMEDLKAGRIIKVDDALVKKVQELKAQYEAIKAMQDAIENGSYNKGANAYSVNAITGKGPREVGRTGTNGKELNGEQLKAAAEKDKKIITDRLNEDLDIRAKYNVKRERLEYDLQNDLALLPQQRKIDLIEMLAQIENAELQGDKDEVQRLKDKYAQMSEADKDYISKRRELTEKAIEIGTALVNGLFDLERGKSDARLADLDRQKEAELKRAGDSEAAKLAVERKYANESKKIRHEQDVQDRAQALFNIAVSTAVSVAKVLYNPPLAFAVGLLGAVQLGLVAAKPLPQYKDGKNVGSMDRYEGQAIAGEAGREIWERDGKAQLLTQATKIDVRKDDIIYPNDITEKLLRGDYAENSRIMNRSRAQQYAANSLSQRQQRTRSQGSIPSAGAIGKAVAVEFGKLPVNFSTFDDRGVANFTQTANGSKVIQRNRHQLPK